MRDVDRLLDHILIMNQSHVLLDERVYEIQKRLKFIETNNAQLITEALHSISSIGGASIIIPNDDQCETDINLELLFDFIQRKPDLAKTIFNAPEK